MGVKPDLVLIDYVDLLTTRSKLKERKDQIDNLYSGTKGLARELDIPIWTVSQVNRMGAKDSIIEGDKAAGSYDKLMISDFALSLSRRKEDKQQGTGRFHIMKNRYGSDGYTYSVKADTSTGHFEVSEYSGEEEENEIKPVKVISGPLNDFEKKEVSSSKAFDEMFKKYK